MTANEILNRALTLLGYTDQNGNEQLTRRIMNKAIAVINTVYEDLWRICVSGVCEQDRRDRTPDCPLSFADDLRTVGDACPYAFTPIAGLDATIQLKGRALEAFPYGVAAFLAQGENDGDQQQLWMSMYNKKRAGLTVSERIYDVFQGAEI